MGLFVHSGTEQMPSRDHIRCCMPPKLHLKAAQPHNTLFLCSVPECTKSLMATACGPPLLACLSQRSNGYAGICSRGVSAPVVSDVSGITQWNLTLSGSRSAFDTWT